MYVIITLLNFRTTSFSTSAGTWVGVGGQWTEMMRLLKETSPITGQLIVFGRL